MVEAIRTLDWGDRVLCVRVNAWDTQWTYGDVIEVVGNAGTRLDEIMLPKVSTAAEVVALDLLLTQIEQQQPLPIGHIGIEAQIETARGLINVEEICAASPRLETIILGPVDFSASMEMPSLAGGLQIPEYPGDYFHYVFMKILMAGRANGAAGHRRPVREGPRPRGLPRLLHAHAAARLRRQVGAAPRPGHDPQRASSRPARSSTTRRAPSSTPMRRHDRG